MKKLNFENVIGFLTKHIVGIAMVKILIILTIIILDLITTKNWPIQVEIEATFNFSFSPYSWINILSIYIYASALTAISIRNFVAKKLSIN
ncbi:hypothetical protein [Acinetobacter baumannii]